MVLSFLTSRISIRLEKESGEYRPGDTVRGRVRMSTLRGVSARGISVSLFCVEWMCPGKVDGEKGEAKESNVWNKHKKLGGKHMYNSGEWGFEFVLPKDALPTINPEPSRSHPTEGAGMKWYLHAQMDVPASIDLHAHKQIFVY